MPLLTPDPTFYPSPAMAAQWPSETLAYLALINPLKHGRPDAIGVVDVDPQSARCTSGISAAAVTFRS